MPYKTIEDAKKANFPVQIDGKALSISQVNTLASMFDEIRKQKGVKDPMAVAISQIKKTFAVKETFETVKDIFSVGTWNGDKYTKEDLDEMVKNFNENPEVRVPLKIDIFKKGVTKTDNFHGGLPAVGWIKDLKRIGDKLYANITNIPRRVKELIDQKAYRQVSSEIWWNLRYNSKVLRRALTGVALLGAELPGVANLDEFAEFYKGEFEGEEKSYITEVRSVNNNGQKNNEEDEMSKELETKIAQLEAENAGLKNDSKKYQENVDAIKAENDKLKKEKDEAEKREFEAKEIQRKERIAIFIDKALNGNHLLPKHKEMALAVAEQLSDSKMVKFTANGKQEEVGTLKLFENFIESLPKMFESKTKSTGGEMETELESKLVGFTYKENEGSETSQKLDYVAMKLVEEKELDYVDALIEARKQFPSLKED